MLGEYEVRQVAQECTSFLAGHLTRDWSLPVPGLEMTVAQVVAHIAETCFWYAIDLLAAGEELSPIELRVEPETATADLIDTLATAARVVAAAVATAAATARGFHPAGRADRTGFAAMACDEMLVHTDDAARGLGSRFSPPSGVPETVLRRLFPWVAVDADPWDLLRWANGRISVAGRPQLERTWTWHCAPLEEWNGKAPWAS